MKFTAIFTAVLLIFAFSFSTMAQQNPAGDKLALQEGTGRISKIDPNTRTITLQDFTMTSAIGEQTDPAAGSASGTSRELKYNERTSFASSNPEAVDGRMSDLKVGDAVSIQFDDQNTIVRIEEISSAVQSQQ